MVLRGSSALLRVADVEEGGGLWVVVASGN